MGLAPLGGHGAVPRDDRDLALHGLLEDRHQGVGVVGGHGDGVDPLRDQRVEGLGLAFGGRGRRAGIDQLDIAEFLGRFLAALAGGLEEADAERLHDQGDADIVRRHRRAGAKGQAECHGGGQSLSAVHGLPPLFDRHVFVAGVAPQC
jgi:hypothetical protein